MNAMIELRSVTKRFGDFLAVNEINLSIRAGEFITLLGPSGCGKTTLLRMISGFETPTSGTILLDGKDVTHTPPYRRDVNQVFQSYALFPHMTVRENINFGLRMKKVPKAEAAERVRAAVAMVSLEGMEDRKPAQLSGGQRQRVALARALAAEAPVLVLHDPTTAVDTVTEARIAEGIREMRRGRTTLLVTTSPALLARADRVVLLDGGTVRADGRHADLVRDDPRYRAAVLT